MNPKDILSKLKQRFGMISDTNRLVHQIRFNQKKYLLEQNIQYILTQRLIDEKNRTSTDTTVSL